MTILDAIEKTRNVGACGLTFADRMVMIRAARGLGFHGGQAIAAEKLGISKQVLSCYENGKKTAAYESLIKIAKGYNCSVDWLCGLTEDVGGKEE